MSETKISNRRQFLAGTFGVTTGLTALFAVPKALAAVCGITPAQTEGPFYPQSNPLNDQNNDLTVVPRPSGAKHDWSIVYVTGSVIDQDCKPVTTALVEIWQACETGRYNHSGDTSGLKLNKDFGYWGEMYTDDKGRFAFKTIIPGYYPAAGNWYRPPHIHFKLSKRGYGELITQMYFDPKSFADPKLANKIQDLNDKDLILSDLKNKSSVIVKFDEVPAMTPVEFNKTKFSGGVATLTKDKFITSKGERVGDFEIVIKKLI